MIAMDEEADVEEDEDYGKTLLLIIHNLSGHCLPRVRRELDASSASSSLL